MFDNKRQPQLLSALTDVGQPDQICPLCEKYFSSTTELSHCSLGKDNCYLHTIQWCCFSCLRPGLYDVFQCLAIDNNDMNSDHNNDGEIGKVKEIIDDLATIETASTKSTHQSLLQIISTIFPSSSTSSFSLNCRYQFLSFVVS